MGKGRTLVLICLQVRINVKKYLFAFENHLQQQLGGIHYRSTMIAYFRFSD